MTKIEHVSSPFIGFKTQLRPLSFLRKTLNATYRQSEPEAVAALYQSVSMSTSQRKSIEKLAHYIAKRLRQQKITYDRNGIVQALLQEYSLSSQEGIALMCLAEALLRIPDKATRDALINDKLQQGNWREHVGKSESLFVNSATWGLVILGKLTRTTSNELSGHLSRLIAKQSIPLIRKAVDMAMRIMGTQFVTGQTIKEALKNGHKLESKGFLYSYDMLGEAALTEEDASRYMADYLNAIHAIGRSNNGKDLYHGAGISIKLSALHPRYFRSQYERLIETLSPRLKELALLAKQYNVGINIDAEEAERLDISVDLLDMLCHDAELKGWNGIGFVIQAYQKRCPALIDTLLDIAKRSEHRLMIRLVKGAYWDSEIKLAQVNGLADYPVYTRKVYTDLSYIACAKKLLAHPDLIYPQFATHNAHTVSAVYHLAGNSHTQGQYEFQCLHGMGEALYKYVVGKASKEVLGVPCRIYAPVGSHETLLAYLVRRLLENGANSSFVNRIADKTLPLASLIADPINEIKQLADTEGQMGLPHPYIPLPNALYGHSRKNSMGIDLTDEVQLIGLSEQFEYSASTPYHAHATHTIVEKESPLEARYNPANHNDLIGYVQNTSNEEIRLALNHTMIGCKHWANTLPTQRAEMLLTTANIMEQKMPELMALLVREAGKSFANAIAEIREAIDFLRYYAIEAKTHFNNETHHPLGPIVCISPWNFPLAIFTGQIAAALACGNSVLAKPAEQTPLIAAQAIDIFHQAGIPNDVLQLLPGDGESVGAALVAANETQGVMFTGSTAVAKHLQHALSKRLSLSDKPIPLVAETGGLNAMIVDSSALTEQVVIDVMNSAFDSAGQRCSALRLLCIQQDVYDDTLTMLKGAMSQARVSDPCLLSTDIGPLIDLESKKRIEAHIHQMKVAGHPIYQSAFSQQQDSQLRDKGYFVQPTLIELNSPEELKEEIFGPVLHVVKYQRNQLQALINHINGSGYGLTLGIHSRIEQVMHNIAQQADVGNLYINRNIVGAVVGVQPFGGEGLSGTGPKAGGPLYLLRLLSKRPYEQLPSTLEAMPKGKNNALLAAYKNWLESEDKHNIAKACKHFSKLNRAQSDILFSGPTGEDNTYRLKGHQCVLSIATGDDRLIQLAAILAVSSQALWLDNEENRDLFNKLPSLIQPRISFVEEKAMMHSAFDVVLYHGEKVPLLQVTQSLAQRAGPIISIHAYAPEDHNILLESLYIEQSISNNTTAAGGNATLMSMV